MNCLRGRGDMEDFNDIPKYHKKGKSSKSSSAKRSDHKHNYEKVISNDGWIGFIWGKRCKGCGRMDTYYQWPSALNYQDFVVADGPRSRRGMTVEEVREKFPDIPIYVCAETGEYELVDI